MNKTKKLKIKLNPETIRALTTRELSCAAGGWQETQPPSAGTGCKTCG